jgi:hypothetical protein
VTPRRKRGNNENGKKERNKGIAEEGNIARRLIERHKERRSERQEVKNGAKKEREKTGTKEEKRMNMYLKFRIYPSPTQILSLPRSFSCL